MPAAAPAAAMGAASPASDPSRMVTVTMPADSTSTVTLSPNHPNAGQPEPGVVAPSNAPPLAEDPLLANGQAPVPPNYDAHDYAPAVTVAQANEAAEKRAGVVPSRDEAIAQGAQLPDL